MARATREEWTRRVEQWRDSDLAAEDFARKIEVNVRTLKFWKWRLAKDDADARKVAASRPRRRQPKRSRPARVPVVEVVTTSAVGGEGLGAHYEIVLGSATVRVPEGFDDGTLGRLLSIVETR